MPWSNRPVCSHAAEGSGGVHRADGGARRRARPLALDSEVTI